MKRNPNLETALERIGRILTRNYDIAVRCRGNECKTDGRTIWLPALPDEVPGDLWRLLRGEIDHEAAHILFSDFKGRMRRFRRKWGDFGFDLLNVIEDVRVNHAMAQRYPGARDNIRNSIEVITARHRIHAMPLSTRFLCALCLAGEGMDYQQYGPDAVALAERFAAEAQRFASLRSTNEACQVAERILKQLQAEPMDEQATPPPPQTPPKQNDSRQNDEEQQNGNATHPSPQKSEEQKASSNQEEKTRAQGKPNSHPKDKTEEKQEGGEANSGASTSQDGDDGHDAQSEETCSTSTAQNDEPETSSKPPRDDEESQESGASPSDGGEEAKPEETDTSASTSPQTNQQKKAPSSDGDDAQDDEAEESGSTRANQRRQDNNPSHQDDQSADDEVSDARSPDAEEENEAEKPSILETLQNHYDSNQRPLDLARNVQRMTEALYGQADDNLYRIYDPGADRILTPPNGDPRDGRDLLNAARPYIAPLRQSLLRTLRAQEARFWIGEQEDGAIDPRRLHALIAQHSPAVFRRKSPCETRACALTLLIDLSDSMRGDRIHLARQAAALFAETLHRLRTPYEIIGFSSEDDDYVKRRLKREKLDPRLLSAAYARVHPAVYTLFKTFREPYQVFLQRVETMQTGVYTPIEAAVLFAAQRLAPRPEPRRILLVLTDGEPYNGNIQCQPAVLQQLRLNLERIARAGIECAALGIQTDSVQDHFDDCIVIHHLAELPRAFYAKFSQLLRKPAR